VFGQRSQTDANHTTQSPATEPGFFAPLWGLQQQRRTGIMLRMSQIASKPPSKPEKRQRVDWDAVERDYRTGKFTLRELEAKHGVSFAQISRKSKEQAWEKDLRGEIKLATDAALLRDSVTNAQKNVTDVVLVAAEVNTQVILGHRKGLQEITQVRNLLLSQVAQAAAQLPELSEVIEMLRQPNDMGIDKANDMMRKAMQRTALVDDLKKLAEVDEKVRKGEREAFGIGGEVEDNPDAKPKRVTIEFVDVVAK